jgi:hypothetical protein
VFRGGHSLNNFGPHTPDDPIQAASLASPGIRGVSAVRFTNVTVVLHFALTEPIEASLLAAA